MRLRPWLLATLLCLLYAGVVVARGGPLALVTVGMRYGDGDPASDEGSEGYDGQFVYAIARDPADAARFLDEPAYRYQRILLPALARAVAFGQEPLLPWALLGINVVALAAGTALLERLLTGYGVSRWYALGYGLSAGTFGAATLSLTEPLAYALALGGLHLTTRKQLVGAGLLLALAALAKETTLVLAAGIALYLLSQRQWRDAVVLAVLTLAPFAAWQLVLLRQFGTPGIGSGGAMATGFEIVPLAGVLRILTEGGPLVFAALAAILAPFVLLPTFWGLRAVWRDARRGAMTLESWLLLPAGAVMLVVPFSTYREPLGILRFIVGLQIAVILYAAARGNQRALLYSTLWALTSLFVIAADRGA